MVAVNHVANTGWEVIRGAFADAILRARHASDPAPSPQGIAIVAGPRITDRLAQRLGSYRDEYARDMGWGVIDRDGRIDLWGSVDIHQKPTRPARGIEHRSVNIWSDLGRWVMKVLLMNTIAPTEAARWMPDVKGASHARLAAIMRGIGGPSSSLIWKVTSQLREEGFLDEDNTVLRAAELLERWRHRQTRPTSHRMSWVLAGGDTRARLGPLIASGAGRACLAGSSACREHGLAITVPNVTEVYMRSIDLAKDVKLAPTLDGDRVDVLVHVPEAPESVFRGVAQASDGVLYADLIQCWLDLVDASAHGTKQADVIWKRRFHFP